MTHKFNHFLEAFFSLLVISWQPILGSISSAVIIVYYISKLKIDVVDTKYSGSWKQYFKSILKIK